MSPDPVVAFKPASLTHATTPERAADVERSRAAGYAAGWAAGARAAAQDAERRQARLAEEQRRQAAEHDAAVRQAIGLLETVAQAVREREAPELEACRAALHAAALDLAEAILGVELSDGPHAARAALTRALALPVEEGPFAVRMHPEDVRQLSALLEDGGSAGAGSAPLRLPAGVELRPDPTVARGDAISERADGYLDARIGAALERARAALVGEDG